PPQGPAEQQIWTYRFARPGREANPPPLPPAGVRVTTGKDSAGLTWKASPSPNVARYVISRGEGEHPWEVTYREVARVGGGLTTFRDADLKRGTVYHYAVRAADRDGRLG